jgi:hypothetical protein
MRTDATALLHELQERGFVVMAINDKVRVKPRIDDQALITRLRAAKTDLLTLLRREERYRVAEEESDRIAQQDAGALPLPDPAEILIKTCTEFGITLSLESDGTLVIGRGAWAGLVRAIERYANQIATLLQADWTPYDA